MSRHSSVRRALGALGGSLVAAALGLQLAPAQAVTPSVDRSFFDAGGFLYPYEAACPAPGNPWWQPESLAADGAWHETSKTLTGTYVGTAWRRTVTTRARIARDSRGLARVDITSTATSHVDPSTGSQTCQFDNEAVGSVTLNLTVPGKAWLVLRSRLSAESGAGQAIGRAGVTRDEGALVEFVNLGDSRTRLVAAGSYDVTLDGGARTHVSIGSTETRTKTASVAGSVSFIPVGTLRSQVGAGLSYLTPRHRNCSANSVALAFRPAVRTKVRSITFSVDGARRFTLRGSRLDRSAVTLRDLAPRKDGVVRASIVLKTGAKKAMTATSWPCA